MPPLHRDATLPIAACSSCVAYEPDATTLGREGNCHYNPPQIVAVSAKTQMGVGLVPGAMFPRVGKEWWCLRYQRREAMEREKAQ